MTVKDQIHYTQMAMLEMADEIKRLKETVRKLQGSAERNNSLQWQAIADLQKEVVNDVD